MSTSTITPEQEQAIRARLEEHPTLAVGVGTEEEACSIASINLAPVCLLAALIEA